MGEYATRRSDGEHIKIGTCENMYYLRYDQRQLVTPEPGNVDPVKDAAEIRFRFPWPDEDTIQPGGEFHDYDFDRSIAIDGFIAPEGVNHCGKCEGGACYLVQTRFRPELRANVPVLKCGGCGTRWREEDPARIEEMAVRLRSHADTLTDVDQNAFYHGIANRVLAMVTDKPKPTATRYRLTVWATCPNDPADHNQPSFSAKEIERHIRALLEKAEPDCDLELMDSEVINDE